MLKCAKASCTMPKCKKKGRTWHVKVCESKLYHANVQVKEKHRHVKICELKTCHAILALKFCNMIKYSQETFACLQERMSCGTMTSRASQRSITHDKKKE